ncbi:hypothetical protein KHA80_05475 [Anaerobacillus sp. HL2]|nr:hypothetical protein KHA80_05475 [Anaerobacillus sp. HL2]
MLAYDYVGDRQSINQGGTTSVSLKLYSNQSRVNIRVYNVANPSVTVAVLVVKSISKYTN